MQRVLELLLGHLRAARDRARLGAPIKLRLGAPVMTRARARGPAPTRGQGGRIAPAHGGAAFAPSARADMGPALALLLVGFAAGLLALGLGEVAGVLALARIFRRARFLERDGNGLAAALDAPAPATAAPLELAMLELVHDAAGGLALSG